MKRLLWVGVAVALASPAAAETRLGVLGGVYVGKLHASAEDASDVVRNKTDFAAGAVVEWGRGGRAWLRLEPMFVRKGSRFAIPEDDFLFDEALDAELDLDYLELPVLVRLDLTRGSWRPYVVAGPTVALRTAGRISAAGETEDDLDDLFEKSDVGLTAGAGVEGGGDGTRFFLEGRYSFGLSNIGKDTEDETVDNRGFLILAGVSFGIGR